MKNLVFTQHRARVSGYCKACYNKVSIGDDIVRQGSSAFHLDCFKKRLQEQIERRRNALTQLGEER